MPLGEQVPVYFTVQPAGGHITHGWATVDYPNYNHAKPGSTLNFWHYNMYGAGWGIYGRGTVDRAGNQVRPNPGTWVTDFNGEMLSEGESDPVKSWLAKFLNSAGDPVDPGSGLYESTQTDLSVNDVIPLTFTRGYNSGDGNERALGNNSNDIYDTFLSGPALGQPAYQDATLNLIDGGTVHFTRISPGTGFDTAIFEAQSTSPQFYHATISWNGWGWNLTLRDGLTLMYGVDEPLQAIRDAQGNTVRIYRMYQDEDGQYYGPITNVISPNGYWLAYSWNNTSASNPLITQVTDDAGQTVSYTYDGSGNLKTVTDPDGNVTTYGYNSGNELTSITDPTGVQYLTNTYSGGKVATQAIAGQGS
jgi:YD repeat-containing protein